MKLLVYLFSIPLLAQVGTPPTTAYTTLDTWMKSLPTAINAKADASMALKNKGTYAAMVASSPSINDVWLVTDATSVGYCAAGGGTKSALCVYTSLGWAATAGLPGPTAAGASGAINTSNGGGGWVDSGYTIASLLAAGGMAYPTGTGIPRVVSGLSWGTTYGVVTTLGSPGSDSNIPTEAAVRTAIGGLGGGHTQNTDTGTTSATFGIDTTNSGPKLKNNAGVLEVRNSADSAYAAVKASLFSTDGGVFQADGSEQSAPTVTSPTIYFNSAYHLPQYLNASSALAGTMVVPAASRTANQFVTHVPSTGTPSTAGIAAVDLPAALANSTSVNGTAIAASKTILYTDSSAGSFPTLNQNTSGTAANLSGTPALPNGTTATTQSAADNSTKLATTAYVDAGLSGKAASGASTAVNGQTCALGSTCTVTADPASAKYKTRTCELHIWGSGTSQVLQDADDEPASCYNDFGVTETITAVRCWANAGSPTVTPIITGGSATSILTGALTCGTASWAAGTLNGTPTLSAAGTIDGNITTAGGTATNIRLVLTLTR